jgi:formiminoglutamase
MKPFELVSGEGPVILAQPHSGTFVPDDLMARLNERGRALADTDWHVDRLYAGLLPGATAIRANFHRYVVDANRDPSGRSLYPGMNTTELVPTVDFEGEPIWTEEPDDAEIAERREAWHQPYHEAIAAEIERIKARHGIAVLYDCHSIRGTLPFLFEGRLPDFNIGDNDGRSCDPKITAAARDVCAGAEGFTHVVDGRFKGGWTTRHYGRPENGVHAIQMELVQDNYLESEAPPFRYSEAKAERVRAHLSRVLKEIERLALSGEIK